MSFVFLNVYNYVVSSSELRGVNENPLCVSPKSGLLVQVWPTLCRSRSCCNSSLCEANHFSPPAKRSSLNIQMDSGNLAGEMNLTLCYITQDLCLFGVWTSGLWVFLSGCRTWPLFSDFLSPCQKSSCSDTQCTESTVHLHCFTVHIAHVILILEGGVNMIDDIVYSIYCWFY